MKGAYQWVGEALATSAKTDMGKPLFKASDGGRVDILEVSEDVTESELRQVSEMRVLILPEVRP